MERITCRGLFLVLVVWTLSLPVPAPAFDWGPNGIAVCGSACVADNPKIIPDRQGGAFVAWRDLRDYPSTDFDVYLQRITSSGAVALGWPSGGLPVCVDPASQNLFAIAPDGQGGVLVVWQDFRNASTTNSDIYAQRILGDGTIATGWPENGAQVSEGPDYDDLPSIAPDGSGGAFVAWNDWRDYNTVGTTIYAQHLNASGAVAAGWPRDGLRVCRFGSTMPFVLPDDSGGVVVVWTDGRRGGIDVGGVDVRAQRLTAGGTIVPPWAEDGSLVVPNRTKAYIASDRAGGFYVGCSRTDFSDLEYTAQRFTFAGAVAPGWPDSGVRVAIGLGEGLKVREDGLGGLLFAWYDYRSPRGGSDVYAARVLPDGSLAPGWMADGTLVSDPAEGLEFEVDISPDMTGGAYVAWEWERSDGRPCRLQHLTASGGVWPGWPPFGVRIAETNSQFTPQLAPDGKGGAIVAWDERGNGRLGIYAQHFAIDEPVPTLISVVSTEVINGQVVLLWQGRSAAGLLATVYRRAKESEWESLGSPLPEGSDQLRFEDRSASPGSRYAYRLGYRDDAGERFTAESWVEVPALQLALAGLRPNPAVGELNVSFSLPNDAPARIELIDVAGRRAFGEEVGSLGPGDHLLNLGRRGTVAAGIYWIRLTQSGRTLTTKGVVAH